MASGRAQECLAQVARVQAFSAVPRARNRGRQYLTPGGRVDAATPLPRRASRAPRARYVCGAGLQNGAADRGDPLASHVVAGRLRPNAPRCRRRERLGHETSSHACAPVTAPAIAQSLRDQCRRQQHAKHPGLVERRAAV